MRWWNLRCKVMEQLIQSPETNPQRGASLLSSPGNLTGRHACNSDQNCTPGENLWFWDGKVTLSPEWPPACWNKTYCLPRLLPEHALPLHIFLSLISCFVPFPKNRIERRIPQTLAQRCSTLQYSLAATWRMLLPQGSDQLCQDILRDVSISVLALL